MAEIVIQGEHYSDADELASAIVALVGQAEEMPSDIPEHGALIAHIGKLREAMPEDYDWDAAEQRLRAEDEPLVSATELADENDAETTTDLREAAETDKVLCCPTCGQEVPFPEVPPIDNTVERCDNCDGWGKVIRPTRVDGQIWHDCPNCDGNGYRAKQGALSAVPSTVKANASPQWDGAIWDDHNDWWNPPAGSQPPWQDARWDHYEGAWK